jgi:outer membrane lipoprotein carrier protein
MYKKICNSSPSFPRRRESRGLYNVKHASHAPGFRIKCGMTNGRAVTKFFLLILLFYASHTVWAAGDAAQLLQQKLAQFQSMTAAFEQVVQSADGTVLQQSKGTMAIQKPGRFRWNTQTAPQQLIITDGLKVWIYDPELSQVTIRPLDRNVGETPVLLLLHPEQYLQKSFVITQKTPDIFILQPQHREQSFNKIILTFHRNTLAKMQLSNQLGQQTMITFSQVRLNPVLNQSLFIFKIPVQVDVIDQTKHVT